jgi:diacylglycerol O-acyltransferase / wax synthase
MPTSQIERRHSRLLSIETPTALGHTSTLTIVDAANAPHRLNAALLRQEVAARLDDHPMLRQSLAEVPLNLDRPWWRDHPGFDLNYHLRHIAVPDPDDPDSLAELVARIHSRPLDRGRPLWELYLISGLADGRAALLFKMHLAALAASTGNSLCAGLIGPSPELLGEPSDEARDWMPEPGPSLHDIGARAWLNAMVDPMRTLTTVPRTLNSVPGIRSILNPALALMNQRSQRSIVIAEQSGITPRTSFNTRIGPHRRWASAELDLQRIAKVRSRFSVSTVDVLTAVCGGALRWWLLEHDELPRESLKALVPLSVTDPEAIEGIAGAVVSLSTNLHRVPERLSIIHDQIGEAVFRHGAMTAAEIRGIGGGTPLLGRGIETARAQPARRPVDAAVQHHDHLGARFEGRPVRARRRGHGDLSDPRRGRRHGPAHRSDLRRRPAVPQPGVGPRADSRPRRPRRPYGPRVRGPREGEAVAPQT